MLANEVMFIIQKFFKKNICLHQLFASELKTYYGNYSPVKTKIEIQKIMEREDAPGYEAAHCD